MSTRPKHHPPTVRSAARPFVARASRPSASPQPQGGIGRDPPRHPRFGRAARAVTLLVPLGLLSTIAGCASSPAPDRAAAVVRVEARPAPGAPAPAVAQVSVYDAAPTVREDATGQFARVDYANLSDVVVWLEPAGHADSSPTTSPAPPPAVTVPINPRDERAADAVRPVSVGQRVVFANRSGAPLPVYSVSDGNEFDLEPIGPGAAGAYVVQGPGLIEVIGDPAGPPVARLYAAPSPWVARTRAGRTVRFDDLPPGQYRVRSWHPRLPGSSADVTLPPGRVTKATLLVGVGAMSEAAGGTGGAEARQ